METLLAIITIIQRSGGRQLFLRLFSRLMVLLGLIITTAIMVAAFLIGSLMHAHVALLNQGMPTPAALLLIGAIALFIIVILITMIAWQLGKLQRYPKTSPLMNTLDAFTEGLMAD